MADDSHSHATLAESIHTHERKDDILIDEQTLVACSRGVLHTYATGVGYVVCIATYIQGCFRLTSYYLSRVLIGLPR